MERRIRGFSGETVLRRELGCREKYVSPDSDVRVPEMSQPRSLLARKERMFSEKSSQIPFLREHALTGSSWNPQIRFL
jgi:hypothetical protein